MGTSIDRMKATLPSIMRTDFWLNLVESAGEEVEEWLDDVTQDRKVLDVENGTTDQLYALAGFYGYTPNMYLHTEAVDDTFLQREVELIPIRIQNKSTIEGYDLNFRTLGITGNIYNIYWDRVQFIRSMDTDAILTAIFSANVYEPFTAITPEENFSTFTRSRIYLDSDEVNPERLDFGGWRLDEENIIGTSHLAVEHVIDTAYEYPTSSGTYYLLDERYFNYYTQGNSYNRAVENVIHTGAQLTMLMGTSGNYDYDTPTGESYSIPDLMTNCAVTLNFRRLAMRYEMIALDDGYTLDDDIIPWYLDQGYDDTDIAYNNDHFHWIVAGTGAKSLVDTAHEDIFDHVILRWEMGENYGPTVKDSSLHENDGSVVGDWRRVTGILGQTVDFEGDNYVTSDSTIAITDGDLTISFWLNPDSVETGDKCVFDLEGFYAYYDHVASELIVGSTYTSNVFENGYSCAEDTESFWQIEVSWDAKELYVYKDTVLVDTVTLTAGIAIAGDLTLYVGSRQVEAIWGSSAVGEFEGIIDGFTILNVLWTADQKSYLYSGKISNGLDLARPVFRRLLSTNNYTIDDLNNIAFIQGIVESNRVENEIIAIGDGSTIILTGLTEVGNIEPGSFYIEFPYTDTESLSLRDNYEGVLTDDRFTGTINYTTGSYSLMFYQDYFVENQEQSSLSGSTAIVLLEAFLQTGTVRIQYFVTGDTNAVIATDDGSGNMVLSDDTNVGTVDYATGVVSLDLGSDTFLSTYTPLATYTYRLSSLPLSGEEVLVHYNTTTNLDITEVGIEDFNHNLMIYGTFPAVNFGSSDNHLGVQFGIIH